MSRIDKMIAKDAAEYVRAEMFFGEGAGTRRKLIGAVVAQRAKDIPGYDAKFQTALHAQDWADHAIMAAKERKRLDRLAGLGKNVNALKRGNVRGLTNVVFVGVGVIYVLKATGYDKVVEDEMNKAWIKAKRIYALQKANWETRPRPGRPT